MQRRVLLFSLLLLALLFAITAALARTYHAREEGLVSEWFQKGNTDLADGKPTQAFEDFRNSLSYGPENTNVQLRLAEALLADGRFTEARSYLVNLWDRAPGSGEVNLDLAHVSMQTGDMDQAIRYFRGAIFGQLGKGSRAPETKCAARIVRISPLSPADRATRRRKSRDSPRILPPMTAPCTRKTAASF